MNLNPGQMLTPREGALIGNGEVIGKDDARSAAVGYSMWIIITEKKGKMLLTSQEIPTLFSMPASI